jgi:hypothetical protein
MSQKHSSFSLLASLINQNKLIYLYENDILEKNEYTYFPHIINYKKIINL